MTEFQYYFAQREALETIIYLYDVFKVRDKYDLIRFDGSGAVSMNMFDEDWAAVCVEDGDGNGQNEGNEPGDRLEFLSQVV